jgi:two-component system, NarL family, sensor histidine kinase BarA
MDTLQQLPIIDWEDSTRLAGHKKELARDMLNMLARDLPLELQTMQSLNQDKNYQELLRTVHKLHGAVCYTGTPRLKRILSTLETNLKTNIMDCSSTLLHQLDIEVSYLLEHLAAHNNQLNQQ